MLIELRQALISNPIELRQALLFRTRITTFRCSRSQAKYMRPVLEQEKDILADMWAYCMARRALPRSWDDFSSSLPDSNETLCMLNRQCELTLSHPTVAVTAASSK